MYVGNDLLNLVILQKIRTAYLHPWIPVRPKRVKTRKAKEEQPVESFALLEIPVSMGRIITK